MSGLYDYRWQRRREHQLREEPLCRICMAVFQRARAATVADHIEPHRGDSEKFAGPLQSLCKPCHDSVKAQQEKSGTFTGCDVHGRPLDPNHHWNRDEEK